MAGGIEAIDQIVGKMPDIADFEIGGFVEGVFKIEEHLTVFVHMEDAAGSVDDNDGLIIEHHMVALPGRVEIQCLAVKQHARRMLLEVEDVPAEVRRDVQFVFVEDAAEVLRHALTPGVDVPQAA